MSLQETIRQLAADHQLKMHIWPRSDGRFQCNVSEEGATGWTVVFHDDPVEGLALALRQRLARVPDRAIVVNPRDAAEAEDAALKVKYDAAPKFNDPAQIDIEEAIAAATVKAPVPQSEMPVDAEGMCLVCENGGTGCDACKPDRSSEPPSVFEDLFG